MTGVCPSCAGSGRRAVPEEMQRYKTHTYGYDPATDTLACRNCGGQTMSGRGTGQVPLRDDGTPCLHSYGSHSIGRCYTEYRCRYCDHRYCIDSGD